VRAVQRVHLVADFEDAAVHEPRHHRRELTADHREHRLVEQLETGADLSQIDERAGFDMARHGGEVGIVESLADCRGFRRTGARFGGIAFAQNPLDAWQEDVAVLDAIDILDQSLRACDPGIRLGELAAKQER